MSNLVQRKDQIQNAYRHVAKPEWGMAVIAWEREGKRGYQFEDGQLRVFATGHYHLLDAIAIEPDRMRTLLAFLGRMLPQPTSDAASAAPATVVLPSLDEQIEFFLRAYPGGFAGDRWLNEHRRGASGRVRKRHRDPAIAFAREKLTPGHLATCLERRRPDEAIDTLSAVLGKTDLVAYARVQRLVSLAPERARGVVVALYDLLQARDGAEVRLMQWIQALTRGTGQAPTWNLATAPLALVDPAHHVCVHRTTFLAQAAVSAPRLRLPVSPSGYAYGAVLSMAEQIRVRLGELGAPPADRFDVHDFIAATVRTEAREEMAARRERARA